MFWNHRSNKSFKELQARSKQHHADLKPLCREQCNKPLWSKQNKSHVVKETSNVTANLVLTRFTSVPYNFSFHFLFFRLLYPTMNEPVCHNLLKSSFDEKLDEQRVKGKEEKEAHDELPATKKCAGYCSAYCTNKDCLRAEIKKTPLKTSDIYAACNLPKRFEHPRKFCF